MHMTVIVSDLDYYWRGVHLHRPSMSFSEQLKLSTVNYVLHPKIYRVALAQMTQKSETWLRR
jgi:hypothetical protein